VRIHGDHRDFESRQNYGRGGAVGFRLGLRLAMLPSVGVLVVGARSAIKSS
jgi:hypothetical protein